jgi:hypothetical protein
MRSFVDSLVFDDAGQLWPKHSQDLRRKFFATKYNGDFIGDAIRQLGFVEVAKSATGYHIKLSPAKVSGIAFAELLYWLNDQEPRNVAISYVTERDHHEIFGNVAKACGRLCELRALYQPHQEAILFQERDVAEVSHSSVLRAALDLWRFTSGRMNADTLFAEMGPLVENRLVVVEPQQDGVLVMSRIGRGFRIPDTSVRHRLEGAPVTAHPDLVFGSWVNSCYMLALDKGLPQLVDADIRVSWPSEGIVRRQYRRLTMPFIDDAGRPLLAGATCVATTTDLRVKVA